MYRVIFAAALSLLPMSGAQASTLSAVELLQQFNLITTGDVEVKSLHVHGRALIGGTMSGNMAEVNHDNIDSIVASEYDELVLGNAGSGTQVRVLNNGSASVNGTARYLDAKTITSPAIAPENYGSILSDFSKELAKKTANSTADKTTLSNRISFNQAGDGGTAVYGITANDLFNREIELALNGFDNIVVNVKGSGNFDLMSNFVGNTNISSRVIWNFNGFDSINLQRSIWGQVLAKDANVSFTADTEGSIFAKSVTAQAQTHLQILDYPDAPPVAPVPLPAAFVLLLAGLGSLGVVRVRNRHNRAA